MSDVDLETLLKEIRGHDDRPDQGALHGAAQRNPGSVAAGLIDDAGAEDARREGSGKTPRGVGGQLF